MAANYYIEAYYPDGSPILGNLDGQAALRVRNYRRTKAYKALPDRLRRLSRVDHYKVVDSQGRILEIIR